MVDLNLHTPYVTRKIKIFFYNLRNLRNLRMRNLRMNSADKPL